MIDIAQVRADTPASHYLLFLNSAGSSLPPKVVLDVAQQYWQEEAQVGGYAYADAMQDEINAFYSVVGTLLNTQPRNVAMAVSATDAYIRALSAIPLAKGDVIVTTDDDYVSNHLHFLSLQKRFDIQIVRGRNLENGDLDLEDFRKQIAAHRPKLVAATHVPTNSGLVQDVEGLGAICSEYDCLYLVDACQSVGQMPVDVQKLRCDFLSATGRKFLRGPRGTGFLYVSDRVLDSGMEPMFPDLQGADWTGPEAYSIQPTAKRFELWEWQYATIIGLRDAISYALDIGLQEIADRNSQLVRRLTSGFEKLSGVHQYDRGSRRAAIVTFRKEGQSLQETKKHLQTHKVAFSVADQGSAQIDFGKKGVDWAIRVSPHYFNTEEEIDRFLAIVEQM